MTLTAAPEVSASPVCPAPARYSTPPAPPPPGVRSSSSRPDPPPPATTRTSAEETPAGTVQVQDPVLVKVSAVSAPTELDVVLQATGTARAVDAASVTPVTASSSGVTASAVRRPSALRPAPAWCIRPPATLAVRATVAATQGYRHGWAAA